MNAPAITPTDSRHPAVAEHTRSYAEIGGAQGHIWNGVPTLLLTTTGRTSGLLRRTALIYGRHDADYLIVASNLGADHHPDWYLNLLSTPLVTIQVRDELLIARAQQVHGATRDHRWSIMTGLWPEYDTYQARTSRLIPVVELQLVASAPAHAQPNPVHHA